MRAAAYFDYNATTPVDPRVLGKMLPFFTEHYGNPSSQGHAYGWAASAAVDAARQKVSDALGANESEIIFTGGASEGISAAIRGVARSYGSRGRHMVTVQTEHKAVLNSFRRISREGFRVTYLQTDKDGLVSMDMLESSLTDDTILVCVMWANNETGVVQPMDDIASCVRGRGILLMTDATQAIGKMPVSVQGADVLVCSGHKVYGPKGIGALYLRRGVRVPPLIEGGGQERGLRAGTLNVPGIVGMGEAVEVASKDLLQESERQRGLRDRMESMLAQALPDTRVNGNRASRLPNTSNVTFPGYVSKDMSKRLSGRVAVSSGSACSTGNTGGVSHVLRAMGVSVEEAVRTYRISLGRFTMQDDVDHAVEAIADAACQ